MRKTLDCGKCHGGPRTQVKRWSDWGQAGVVALGGAQSGWASMRRWHLSFDLDFENESGMQRRFQAEGIPWGRLAGEVFQGVFGQSTGDPDTWLPGRLR